MKLLCLIIALGCVIGFNTSVKQDQQHGGSINITNITTANDRQEINQLRADITALKEEMACLNIDQPSLGFDEPNPLLPPLPTIKKAN